LATALFDVDGVERVYLGGDFVTITKADSDRVAASEAARARGDHGSLHLRPPSAWRRQLHAADETDEADIAL
jgi:hypothetical protein